jgi:hypothetical protein
LILDHDTIVRDLLKTAGGAPRRVTILRFVFRRFDGFAPTRDWRPKAMIFGMAIAVFDKCRSGQRVLALSEAY